MGKCRRRNLALHECWLFAIDSRADLARRLSTDSFGVSVADLKALAADAGNFKLFTARMNGKDRPIQEPKRQLQRLHARIHRLLSRIQTPDYLHSAIRGRSYLTNASAHVPGARTIKIDVKKFFASVPRVAIFRFFHDLLQCRADAAGLLADLLTFDARLPTGSSASPIIAYYAFKPMFDEIAALAEAHGLTMTCYVDDMTLSGEAATRGVLNEVRKIISKHGLRSHKMRAFEANEPKVITGVCNVPSGQRVPNRLHLKISQGFKELREANSREAFTKALTPLLGRLGAANQIDKTFGARARTLRSQIKAKHVTGS